MNNLEFGFELNNIKVKVEYRNIVNKWINELYRETENYIKINEIKKIMNELDIFFKEKVSNITLKILDEIKKFFKDEIYKSLEKNINNRDKIDLIKIKIDLFTLDIIEIENNSNKILKNLNKKTLKKLRVRKWFFWINVEKTKSNIRYKIKEIIEDLKRELVKDKYVDKSFNNFINNIKDFMENN